MRRILQFGTSRFLQAHVDLFVHEAREAGQDVGPVTIIKTTPQGALGRDARVAAFGDPGGYPVLIRGLVAGAEVDRRIMVRSVARGLSADADWPEVTRVFVAETEIVVCNTGDTGYAELEGDRQAPASGAVPRGFPAKLLTLLMARHAAGAPGLCVLPCELVSGNGRALRGAVAGLSRTWAVKDAFLTWLSDEVVFADTLVDRIVSAPIEPVGAIAEPYSLWAIQRTPGLTPPMSHPEMIMTDDLAPYEQLKLYILNLGHTYLADLWLRENRPSVETVREMLADPRMRERLLRLYDDEIVPGFATRGMRTEATGYVGTTMDRLENPFLDHRLADIAQHHAQKIERRIGAFLAWTAGGDACPILAALQRGR